MKSHGAPPRIHHFPVEFRTFSSAFFPHIEAQVKLIFCEVARCTRPPQNHSFSGQIPYMLLPHTEIQFHSFSAKSSGAPTHPRIFHFQVELLSIFLPILRLNLSSFSAKSRGAPPLQNPSFSNRIPYMFLPYPGAQLKLIFCEHARRVSLVSVVGSS